MIDDATFNNDAASTSGSDPTYSEPRLRWSGALGADESTTITYSVTLKGGGDGTAKNVAFGPETGGDVPTPDCVTPDDSVPCATTTAELPKLRVTKTADTAELPGSGETVTYTIKVRNVGPGDYTNDHRATFADDLSDVLDDADYVADSVDASSGTPTVSIDDQRLSWTGVLASGDESTITYQVTYNGEGDKRLVNRACAPEDEAVNDDRPCDTVSIPGANLTQTKTSDPADGAVVKAGDTINYTLTFTNDGTAAGTVDTTDDLSDVLDDADVTTEPTATGGLDVDRDGDTIAIDRVVAGRRLRHGDVRRHRQGIRRPGRPPHPQHPAVRTGVSVVVRRADQHAPGPPPHADQDLRCHLGSRHR